MVGASTYGDLVLKGLVRQLDGDLEDGWVWVSGGIPSMQLHCGTHCLRGH